MYLNAQVNLINAKHILAKSPLVKHQDEPLNKVQKIMLSKYGNPVK